MATCCLIGSAVGIGSVFGGFLIAYSRNSYLKDSLFQYCILGFALSEAVGLLGLMVGFSYCLSEFHSLKVRTNRS